MLSSWKGHCRIEFQLYHFITCFISDLWLHNKYIRAHQHQQCKKILFKISRYHTRSCTLMVSYNGEWNLLSKLSWYPDITPNCVPFQDIPKPQFWRCIPRTDADWNVENRCSTTRCVLCVHHPWIADHDDNYDHHHNNAGDHDDDLWFAQVVYYSLIIVLKTRNEHTKYKKFNGNVDIFIALCVSSQSMDILNEKTFPFWKLLSQ